MGIYINPKGTTKEAWLAANGLRVTRDDIVRFADEDTWPVVLVDNGWMTAAGVGYDADEIKGFLDLTDPRPKRYFLVPRAKILDPDVIGIKHTTYLTTKEE